MRLPWQKRRVERADPNRPHRFKAVSGGEGAVIATNPDGNSALQGIIMPKANVTEGRCGICRRPHDDPIHDLEE